MNEDCLEVFGLIFPESGSITLPVVEDVKYSSWSLSPATSEELFLVFLEKIVSWSFFIFLLEPSGSCICEGCQKQDFEVWKVVRMKML
jgi:hypothetical protein